MKSTVIHDPGGSKPSASGQASGGQPSRPGHQAKSGSNSLSGSKPPVKNLTASSSKPHVFYAEKQPRGVHIKVVEELPALKLPQVGRSASAPSSQRLSEAALTDSNFPTLEKGQPRSSSSRAPKGQQVGPQSSLPTPEALKKAPPQVQLPLQLQKVDAIIGKPTNTPRQSPPRPLISSLSGKPIKFSEAKKLAERKAAELAAARVAKLAEAEKVSQESLHLDSLYQSSQESNLTSQPGPSSSAAGEAVVNPVLSAREWTEAEMDQLLEEARREEAARAAGMVADDEATDKEEAMGPDNVANMGNVVVHEEAAAAVKRAAIKRSARDSTTSRDSSTDGENRKVPTNRQFKKPQPKKKASNNIVVTGDNDNVHSADGNHLLQHDKSNLSGPFSDVESGMKESLESNASSSVSQEGGRGQGGGVVGDNSVAFKNLRFPDHYLFPRGQKKAKERTRLMDNIARQIWPSEAEFAIHAQVTSTPSLNCHQEIWLLDRTGKLRQLWNNFLSSRNLAALREALLQLSISGQRAGLGRRSQAAAKTNSNTNAKSSTVTSSSQLQSNTSSKTKKSSSVDKPKVATKPSYSDKVAGAKKHQRRQRQPYQVHVAKAQCQYTLHVFQVNPDTPTRRQPFDSEVWLKLLKALFYYLGSCPVPVNAPDSWGRNHGIFKPSTLDGQRRMRQIVAELEVEGRRFKAFSTDELERPTCVVRACSYGKADFWRKTIGMQDVITEMLRNPHNGFSKLPPESINFDSHGSMNVDHGPCNAFVNITVDRAAWNMILANGGYIRVANDSWKVYHKESNSPVSTFRDFPGDELPSINGGGRGVQNTPPSSVVLDQTVDQRQNSTLVSLPEDVVQSTPVRVVPATETGSVEAMDSTDVAGEGVSLPLSTSETEESMQLAQTPPPPQNIPPNSTTQTSTQISLPLNSTYPLSVPQNINTIFTGDVSTTGGS